MKASNQPFPLIWTKSGRHAVKDLYMSMVSDEKKSLFWKKYFLENTLVSETLLEVLGNEEVFDCFSYLRNGLLKAPKYNILLTQTNIYQSLIRESRERTKGSLDEKIQFISLINHHIGNTVAKRNAFQLILRKGLMYDNSIDLVDTVL